MVDAPRELGMVDGGDKGGRKEVCSFLTSTGRVKR